MGDACIFLEGRRIVLRPLLESDFTPAYLRWLNDPATNASSQRRPFPVSAESMRRYRDKYEADPRSGFILAILSKPDREHVGNVELCNIQPVNRCAEIAILLGEPGARGRGLGAEVMYLLTRHAFTAMNLHKVLAGTFNPAFVRCVEKIGWRQEGRFRDRIWSGGRYHDQIWLSMLRDEFKRIDEYEAEPV